jgi:prevent-host-death family protein
MKPKEIGAFDAKTRLSELLDRVDKGAVYVITKRGRPVAELRPPSRRGGLEFGSDAGRITIGDDFDAPVPEFQEYLE